MALLSPNPASVDAKKLMLSDGGCVVFLGSGMLMPPAGDWTTLVRKITSKCAVHFDDKTTDYLEVIDECIAKDLGGCNQALKEFIPTHTTITRTALDYIHRFKLKSILTTNFDPWVRLHAREEKFPRVHRYPDLPLKSGLQGGIYYLHGYFDSDNPASSIKDLILGKKSFDVAYDNSSLLPGFLLNCFVYENTIFMGFRPTEPHISDLLVKSIAIRRQITGGATSRRFLLIPAPSGKAREERETEDAYIEKVKALEIEPVYFDNSVGDYSGIEELLNSWVQELGIQDRIPPFHTGFDSI